MGRPDYLEGFGPSNRTPGSSREDKRFISPRTTVIRRGLSRCEVVIVGRGKRWKVFARKDGSLIAHLRRSQEFGWKYERVTRDGLLPSVWHQTKTAAEDALLATL